MIKKLTINKSLLILILKSLKVKINIHEEITRHKYCKVKDTSTDCKRAKCCSDCCIPIKERIIIITCCGFILFKFRLLELYLLSSLNLLKETGRTQ